jgi:N-methylhydantoinase B/oxoprolinase/acetone carboxylase alpha subunit
MAVAAALREVQIEPGDVVALNDPFAGGTHLPDVTLISSVVRPLSVGLRKQLTTDKRPRTLFYVANRAHHADIGGATPGSMGLATDVYGEGVRIPPVRIVRAGVVCDDVMKLILTNVRSSDERRADFAAQTGSLETGEIRLLEIVARRGENEHRRAERRHRFETDRGWRRDAGGEPAPNTTSPGRAAEGNFRGERANTAAGGCGLRERVGGIRRGRAGAGGQLHERRRA